MKSIRITVIFGIIAATLVGVLYIAGVMDADAANSVLTKIVGIVFLIGLGSQAVALLAKKPDSPETTNTDKQGPQF